MDFDSILHFIQVFLWGDPDLAANTAIIGQIIGAVGGGLFSGLLGKLFGGGKGDDKAARARVAAAEAKAEAAADEAQDRARERRIGAAQRLRALLAPGQGLLSFFDGGR